MTVREALQKLLAAPGLKLSPATFTQTVRPLFTELTRVSKLYFINNL